MTNDQCDHLLTALGSIHDALVNIGRELATSRENDTVLARKQAAHLESIAARMPRWAQDETWPREGGQE